METCLKNGANFRNVVWFWKCTPHSDISYICVKIFQSAFNISHLSKKKCSEMFIKNGTHFLKVMRFWKCMPLILKPNQLPSFWNSIW